jgi:hypothetical protein
MTPFLFLLATQPGNVPPTVKLSLPPKVVSHAAFDAKLTVTFSAGLHGYQNPPSDQYSIPVVVKLLKGDAKLVKVEYPKGADLLMAGESKPAKVYSGSVTIPVHLVAGTKTGDLVFSVDYQQCTESNCFPPSAVQAKGTLHVAKKK